MIVKQGEYVTAKELSEILKINLKAVQLRIFRYGIKPISKDALYPISILETLKKTPPKGRPQKAAPKDKSKPVKKPVKAKINGNKKEE